TDYEFAAADVNGSGTITFSDYLTVIINYLLQGNPFPVGEWQFESVQIDFMARSFGSTDTARVWATGSGDVEGIWVPSGRSLALVNSIISEPVTINHQTTSIEITSGYQELISGFNLNINYPSHLMTITGVEGPDGNLNYAIDQGVVKIIWMDESEHAGSQIYGDHLCTLLVNQKVGITNEQSATMTLQENGMILDKSGLPVEGAEIRLPEIKSNEINVVNEASCYPNPVVNQLNIRLENSLNTTGLLCIYDMSGKLAQQFDLNQFTSSAGVIEINTSQLSPGSYTYVIKTGQQDQVTTKGRFFKSE
ncbi:MAG: T9SS type A sorting domain-containing protein, partial [Bacteroidales bacterium]